MSYVERMLNEAGAAIVEAQRILSSVQTALPSRDYQSLAMHLDKSAAIVAKRINIVARAANAEARRAEKKKLNEKIKEALADPEKAQALKELLNL